MQKFNTSLNSVLNSLKDSKVSRNRNRKPFTNEIDDYFFELCCVSADFQASNILDVGRIQKKFYFTFVRMIKNVLSISMTDVEMKRLFFMTRDVMHYRRNRLHADIIENIMILKKIYRVTRDIKNLRDDFVKNYFINDNLDEASSFDITMGIREDDGQKNMNVSANDRIVTFFVSFFIVLASDMPNSFAANFDSVASDFSATISNSDILDFSLTNESDEECLSSSSLFVFSIQSEPSLPAYSIDVQASLAKRVRKKKTTTQYDELNKRRTVNEKKSFGN